jgi:hypothetical protein
MADWVRQLLGGSLHMRVQVSSLLGSLRARAVTLNYNGYR